MINKLKKEKKKLLHMSMNTKTLIKIIITNIRKKFEKMHNELFNKEWKEKKRIPASYVANIHKFNKRTKEMEDKV